MRLFSKWGSLILLILLCGCTPSVNRNWGDITYWYTQSKVSVARNIYEIRIDSDFSLKEREALLSAITEWNYVLNGQIIFKVIDFMSVGDLKSNQNLPVYGYWMIKIDDKNATIKSLDKNFEKQGKKIRAIAYTNRIGGKIMYFDMQRIEIKELRGVGLHELGHALGAKHHNSGIMNAVSSPADYICVDREAAFQVTKFLNLNWDLVNWCYFGQNIIPDGRRVK